MVLSHLLKCNKNPENSYYYLVEIYSAFIQIVLEDLNMRQNRFINMADDHEYFCN